MFRQFENKPIMIFHSQWLEHFALTNAYLQEKQSFLKTLKLIPVSQIPRDANIVSSQVIYKLKTGHDVCLMLRAQIAPHGNESSLLLTMKTYFLLFSYCRKSLGVVMCFTVQV